jgi:hypothetical protein
VSTYGRAEYKGNAPGKTLTRLFAFRPFALSPFRRFAPSPHAPFLHFCTRYLTLTEL